MNATGKVSRDRASSSNWMLRLSGATALALAPVLAHLFWHMFNSILFFWAVQGMLGFVAGRKFGIVAPFGAIIAVPVWMGIGISTDRLNLPSEDTVIVLMALAGAIAFGVAALIGHLLEQRANR